MWDAGSSCQAACRPRARMCAASGPVPWGSKEEYAGAGAFHAPSVTMCTRRELGRVACASAAQAGRQSLHLRASRSVPSVAIGFTPSCRDTCSAAATPGRPPSAAQPSLSLCCTAQAAAAVAAVGRFGN